MEMESAGAAALLWGPHFVSSSAEVLSLQHFLCGQVGAYAAIKPEKPGTGLGRPARETLAQLSPVL